MTSCKKGNAGDESSVYKTLTVKQENRTLIQEYSARLEGQQVVEVRPQVSGLITRICISEGEKVRKGQLLFVIGQVPYKAALAEASPGGGTVLPGRDGDRIRRAVHPCQLLLPAV